VAWGKLAKKRGQNTKSRDSSLSVGIQKPIRKTKQVSGVDLLTCGQKEKGGCRPIKVVQAILQMTQFGEETQYYIEEVGKNTVRKGKTREKRPE